MISLSAALKIAYECAKLYEANLRNKNLLFIYCEGRLFQYIETMFAARHFMHLTGLRSRSLSANGFYRSCLKQRLSTDDIYFSGAGTTELKLKALPHLMSVPRKNMMIGKSAGDGFRLYTDTLVGTVGGSMGFVTDSSSFYVPNTILRGDIRKSVVKAYPIKAACSKTQKDALYSPVICRTDFSFSDLPEEIRSKISQP